MAEYLRIGITYYKKVKKPKISGELITVILPWSRQVIIDDHGKGFLEDIEKYEGFIVIPSHVNYQQAINNFYNRYMALDHDLNLEFTEGSIPNTLNFMNHIFGDQIEIGLDYLSIIWKKPTQILPILCLVSNDRNTGKTTFLNWLNMIFQDNMTMNTNEDFRSRFNADWSEKLIIGVDEVLLDRKEDSERIKNLSTTKTNKLESKGKDKLPHEFFGKIILCSNNEDSFILLDDKEIRYWVRKISTLNIVDPDLEIKLKKEIPYFVAYLNSRKIKSPNETRMWFSKEQIHTLALDNLIKGTKANLEKELLSIIDDKIEDFELEEINFTVSELKELVRGSSYITPEFKIKEIVEKNWNLISDNSSYYEYYKSIIPGTNDWEISRNNKKGRFFTFKKEFIKGLLNC
ncbi:primase-helicase family protein [Gillisia sp. Q332]|uniref:primase-helicase family protein n=1 Tax=Gillisia xinjiangensis TaxID=3384765 RepID=UPI00391C886C